MRGRAAWAMALLLAAGCAPGAALTPPPPGTPAGVTASATATLPPDRTLTPPGSTLPTAPPAAALVFGGEAYPGELGSYVWMGAGSDVPWLPARALGEPVRVEPRKALSIEVRDTGVSAWSARVAAASDDDGSDAQGAGSGGPVEPGATFAASGPATPGRWVLMVHVVFADDAGDATYYWLLEAA